jgi:hypothetical protein
MKKNFNSIVQVLLPIFTVLGFALTSFKLPQYGLIFNLFAQVFWLYSGYKAWKKADQFGIFATAIVLTIVVVYGVVNYWFFK